MAKRSNPFAEDFLPQSKTHVGLKQFNNNEDRMKKVYEKTLHLLFKGAKKSPGEVVKHMDSMPSAGKDCMKQLLINRDGTLVNSKIIDRGIPNPVRAGGCGGCGGPPAEARCWYCETPLCAACSRHCAHCHLLFCSKCCLLGSEGAEICVSCYG